jgi:hypothetical protein
MLQVLFYAHSWVRWLILLAAAIAIAKYLIGLAGKREFDKMSGGLTSAFSGLMDLQVVLGLSYFLWSGLAGAGFPRQRIEHLAIMIIAAVVAHLPAIWKSKSAAVRYRNTLLTVLVSLLLVVVGVFTLSGNRWVFRL